MRINAFQNYETPCTLYILSVRQDEKNFYKHQYWTLSKTFLGTENRDSGVADVEVCPCQCPYIQNPTLSANECSQDSQIKRSALSNSLLDIHEQCK